MFGTSSKKSAAPVVEKLPAPYLLVFAPELQMLDRGVGAILQSGLPDDRRLAFAPLRPPASNGAEHPVDAEYVLSLFIDPAQLDPIADQVLAARKLRPKTTLIVAINGTQLVQLGQWLERRARNGQLCGLRLMLATDTEHVARQLPQRLSPGADSNVIRMPVSTEVENTAFKNFYVFSPELQALVHRIKGFAQNGINRACLLGGPGSGKTSLSYYYFLQRNKGRFVSVNLAAENTGDKAAVKSLLCGHVSGAFPGAGARTGAFQHAKDGVCFLDESHGITGAVMEVLMEALDNGQYLPFGASAKQQLECALLFASNRSWTTLQNSVNIDEFTRIGAATLTVPPLNRREEEMISVVATLLAKLAAGCGSWKAPAGLTAEAWKVIRECRWHGNIRALIRVLEAAFVDTASGSGEPLIQAAEIERGIVLWEPKTHHSHEIYAAA